MFCYILDDTTSWGCWKHPLWIPGVRPMFLKPKLHKQSKNGFKTISCRRYPLMIFSKNCFSVQKNHQKYWMFWFLDSLCNFGFKNIGLTPGIPKWRFQHPQNVVMYLFLNLGPSFSVCCSFCLESWLWPNLFFDSLPRPFWRAEIPPTFHNYKIQCNIHLDPEQMPEMRK